MQRALVFFAVIALASALNCYTKTTYQCSSTAPTDGATWQYCPENGLWSKMPCSKLIIRKLY